MVELNKTTLKIENDQEILINTDTGEVLATRKSVSISEPRYRRQVDWFFLYHYSRQKGCDAAASLLDVMANNVYMNNVLRDNPALLNHSLTNGTYYRALNKLRKDGIIREAGNRIYISPIYVWYGEYTHRDTAIESWYTGRYAE